MGALRTSIFLCVLFGTMGWPSLDASAQTRGGTPADSVAAAGQAKDSAQRAQQSASEAQTAADSARAERERAAKETADALRNVQMAAEKAEVALGRGETLSDVSNTIMSFTQYIAAALALFAGVQFLQWHRRAKAAESTLKKVEERLETLGKTGENLEQQLAFLNALRAQVAQAFGQIETRLVSLFTPGVYLFGVPTEQTPPQEAYDDDSLIALSARIDLPVRDKQSFVDMLVLSARYWRRYDEFDRAVARLRRAIDVDKTSAAAHHHLGRTLWSTVAAALLKDGKDTATTGYLRKLLEEAQSEIEHAETLRPENQRNYEEALYDLACIARFRGDYARAAELYSKGAERSLHRARHENHAPDFEFEYALACLLAKEGKFAEAFTRLQALAMKKERWDLEWKRLVPCDYIAYVKEDPDLAVMRAEPEWGPKLNALGSAATVNPA